MIIHIYIEREGNPLLPYGLLFPISSTILSYASSHRQNNTYYGLCYTSCGALAGTIAAELYVGIVFIYSKGRKSSAWPSGVSARVPLSSTH